MTIPGVAVGFPVVAPTSEVEWVRLVSSSPELPISTRPVVVVAPHPDDESLAVGGLVAELRMRDVPVDVLAVTDGEASHPHLRNLAARRTAEQTGALRALGVKRAPHRLGLPDGRVAAHASELADALGHRCRPGTLILAPWDHDGHPDHDACGAVAAEVARQIGSTVWSYPVWAWQWAAPTDLSLLDLRRVTLSPEASAAKKKAIDAHQTQTMHLDGPPIIGEEVLDRFRRPWETIIRDRSPHGR